MTNRDERDQFHCASCGISEGDTSNITQTLLQTNAIVGCGHQFCNRCIDREFSRRHKFSCPKCNNQVRRAMLSERTLDDIQCMVDTNWRRRVLKIYNKSEEDFEDLMEYNNYLEEIEDIIYNIVNEEPMAEECKIKLKIYEEKNKNYIVLRQSQRADKDRMITDRIAFEKREAERRKRHILQEEKEMIMAKRKYKLEATQVSLGEREEVSEELLKAKSCGYKIKPLNNGMINSWWNERKKTGPNVRKPSGGLHKEKILDRENYRKRQSAGGGISTGNLHFQERNWNLLLRSLFI